MLIVQRCTMEAECIVFLSVSPANNHLIRFVYSMYMISLLFYMSRNGPIVEAFINSLDVLKHLITLARRQRAH